MILLISNGRTMERLELLRKCFESYETSSVPMSGWPSARPFRHFSLVPWATRRQRRRVQLSLLEFYWPTKSKLIAGNTANPRTHRSERTRGLGKLESPFLLPQGTESGELGLDSRSCWKPLDLNVQSWPCHCFIKLILGEITFILLSLFFHLISTVLKGSYFEHELKWYKYLINVS